MLLRGLRSRRKELCIQYHKILKCYKLYILFHWQYQRFCFFFSPEFYPIFPLIQHLKGKTRVFTNCRFFLSTASAGIVVSQRKVRQISDPIQQILIQLHKVIYITQVSVPAFYFLFIISKSLVLILPKNSFVIPLESTSVYVLWVLLIWNNEILQFLSFFLSFYV